MGRKKPTARDNDIAIATAPPQGDGAKLKKKALVIDDDEYSVGTELSEEQPVLDEKVVPIGGKKKSKKGISKKDLGEKNIEEEDDDALAVQFAGKKKSNSKNNRSNNLFSASSFGLLGEENEDESDDEMSGVTRDEEDGVGSDEDGVEEHIISDHDEEPVIAFSGKKKPSKSNQKSSANVFTESSLDGFDNGDETKDEEDDIAAITFPGKKKKSLKSLRKSSAFVFVDEENEDGTSVSKSGGDAANDIGAVDEDDSAIMLSGRKKSSKKKNNSVFNALELGGESTDVVEPEQPIVSTSSKEAADPKSNKQVIEDVAETSKNKKKKKKCTRTAQEDDFGKILAELGEGPRMSKPEPAPALAPPQEKKAQTQPEPVGLVGDRVEKEAKEGDVVESAAAKKKKKKKEKEEEKKVAAAAAATAPAEQEKQEETKNEIKSKALDKRVPKHVREMQERLARLKELEEKKKKEEEEKLRKEEEERRLQEELERQAEEKKCLRKEKEKGKLLKKKQEGRLLTGKQKEEARRQEVMRNQILANAGGLSFPTGDAGGAPTKWPKYETKKSKKHHSQANSVAPAKSVESTETKESQQEGVAEVDSIELQKVEEVDTMSVEEKTEVADEFEENGIEDEDDDDEEDEWDAKSWDDADLKLPGKSAFADEEADSEPEHVVKKEVKSARWAGGDAGPPAVAAVQKVSQEIEVMEKNKRKELSGKMEAPNLDAQPNQGEIDLRSPICCIMGHVDTGKTKLLDCIQGTNVQEGEAGGITQQIGATYFPAQNIRERTKELKADAKLKVPGLLVIDTPGHESFTNLRSRGSGLCDIAILVVDIMHGLEPQTIESLNLLKMRNTEFIVALNKVDRLYGWKVCRNAPIVKAMKQQSKDVQLEFNMRLTQVITQFKEQGLNTELYYKNKETGETYSIVPTSAVSGEGIPDLLLLLVQWTQKTMVEKLTYSNEVQCTVLEVKVVEGHGTTIDVVLVNGVLHEGDQIVVCGMQGPIVTSIRALLTPHPMKELRVKGTYLHHKEIKAAQGIKITAQGLEHAIAGTSLYVVGLDDDLEDIKESAMEDMKSVLNRIDRSGEGVCVQASTLGSLEALLEFLKSPAVSIPVSGTSIGPVHKKDVMKASVMLEKKKEYATILAFDVKVTPEARELADEVGVKIFIVDIIYHLFDQVKAYIDNLKEEKKKEASEEAVFPCILKIMPNCVFNKKDPIVLGVDVLEGIAKVGTPICIPQKEFIDIGRIASIENNHKPVDYAKKGQKVAIKLVGSNTEEQQKMFGRHFEIEHELVSHISRRSIDVLQTNCRDDLSLEEWKLVVTLKSLFKIQ
ncbi:Eukaryotic translation initiation factor 5B [Camellia lanceoleosa]|uniref:Eukaryotic translation initiation factor 5B n=1 Tax=Camellia lanceoleosa TaxID=1840588 RepID=A0ACC0G809_9ERIC|nr:Eukaryotic translation initiation factor 5B [Camellia lanceoleosa]